LLCSWAYPVDAIDAAAPGEVRVVGENGST
jgi:hypothetical protein